MANTLLPIEERMLGPEDVERLDRRRRRGQMFLVISVQCLVVSLLLTLWSGQDLTYSPGWERPVLYWNGVTVLLACIFGVAGLRMRRGSTEFLSY